MKSNELREEEILLYMSGALAFPKSFFVWILIQLSPKWRAPYFRFKSHKINFDLQPKTRIEHILYGETKTFTKWYTIPRLQWVFPLICLMGIVLFPYFRQENEETLTYVSKGRELGVYVFAKKTKAVQIRESKVELSSRDTLQLIALGKANQFVSIYSLDEKKRMEKIFPESMAMQSINSEFSFPALIPELDRENWLISVSSTKNHSQEEIENVLKKIYNANKPLKPGILWEDEIYLQVYQIEVNQ